MLQGVRKNLGYSAVAMRYRQKMTGFSTRSEWLSYKCAGIGTGQPADIVSIQG